MSIGYIELAVAALGELAKEVTFVGGATLGFWIDPRFGIEARATKDADLVVESARRAHTTDSLLGSAIVRCTRTNRAR